MIKFLFYISCLCNLFMVFSKPFSVREFTGYSIAPGIHVIKFVDDVSESRSSPYGNMRRPGERPHFRATHSNPHVIFFPGETTTSKTEPDIQNVGSGGTGISSGIPDDGSGDPFVIGVSPVSIVSHPKVITNDENCLLQNGTIYYHGECVKILTSEPCNDPSHWLIVNYDTMIPECVARPCPLGQLLYNGSCVEPTAQEKVCGSGQILYFNFFGLTYCDCETNFIFDPNLSTCLAVNQQGSCEDGYYLTLDEHGREVTCSKNPCPTDQEVWDPKSNSCYKKLFLGNCDEKSGFGLHFIENDRTAICPIVSANKNIFETPVLPCPAGSRRDYLGACAQVIRAGSPRSAFNSGFPSQYITRFSYCPPGFNRYPNGACAKANPLLLG